MSAPVAAPAKASAPVAAPVVASGAPFNSASDVPAPSATKGISTPLLLGYPTLTFLGSAGRSAYTESAGQPKSFSEPALQPGTGTVLYQQEPLLSKLAESVASCSKATDKNTCVTQAVLATLGSVPPLPPAATWPAYANLPTV
jgi:hypothetical protein